MNENPIIRVSYTNKATIPTGKQYENQSPCYTVTIEEPINEVVHQESYRENRIKELTQWAKNYIDGLIETDFQLMTNFRTRKQLDKNMYRVIDGKVYPRVTSIITPETPNIPYIEDHAELGLKLDEAMKTYVETGIFAYDDFRDKGNIKMTWDEVYQHMSDTLSKYNGFVLKDHSFQIVNEEHIYSGEMDAYGTYDGKPAIFDFKKTRSLKSLESKYFMQMAAYCKGMMDVPERPQIMVILSPFNPPLVSDQIDHYFEMFLEKRKEFKEVYGI